MLCAQHWVNTLWHLSRAAIQPHISGHVQWHLWVMLDAAVDCSDCCEYGAQFTILLWWYTYFSMCAVNSTWVTLRTSGPLPALLLLLDRSLEVPFWTLALGFWDFTTQLKFAQSENINFCVELAWLSCRRSLLVMRAVHQDTKQEFKVHTVQSRRRCMRSGVQPGARSRSTCRCKVLL